MYTWKRSSFLACCLILLSGDIELNPGPGPRHPCGSCSLPVKSNQRGIYCEVCFYWYHTRCIRMTHTEYERLSNCDEAWCCDRCFKEALPFFDASLSDDYDTDADADVFTYNTARNSSICNDNANANDLASAHISPQHNPARSPILKILSANCRSLTSNVDALRAYTASYNPDIVALCETWLDETVKDIDIFLPNYYVIRRDRNRRGGGVLLYLRDNICTSSIYSHPTLELLTAELTLKQGPLLLGLYYRPPSASQSLTDLETFLQSLPPPKLKSAVLLGDFNIDLLASTSLSHDIASIMSSFHFNQLVTEPTRISATSRTLIDHVYVSNRSLVHSCSNAPPLGSSDHSSILVDLTWTAPRPIKIRRQMWSYRSADWDQANDLLLQALDSSSPASFPDVDSHWSSWKSQFMNIMSTCIPSRIITIKKSLPWINTDIIRVMRKRDHFFRLAKSLHSCSAYRKYRQLRNNVVSLIRKAKSDFLRVMSASVRTPREFWAMYHSLSPNRERIPQVLTNGTVSASSPTSKANLLNSFFSSCFSDNRDSSDTSCPPPGSLVLSHIQCSEDEVEELLCSLKTKTSTGGPDGISSHMLRNTWFSISSSLCSLFNHSVFRLFSHRLEGIQRNSCFQNWKQELGLKLPPHLPPIHPLEVARTHRPQEAPPPPSRQRHFILATVWLSPWQLYPGSPASCHPRLASLSGPWSELCCPVPGHVQSL